MELIGSMIVIAFLAILGRQEKSFWFCGVVLFSVLLYQQSYYSLFVAGLLLAKVYTCNSVFSSRWSLLLWAGFLLGGLSPLIFVNNLSSPFFMLAVILFFASVLWIISIRQFFENRISLFLGRISFPLYLVHAPVLWTFSLWLKAMLAPLMLSSVVVNLTVGFMAAFVSIVVAIAFSPINSFAIYVSRGVGVWLVGHMESFFRFWKARAA